MTKSQKQLAFNVFRYTVLTVWLAIVVFPLFWVVATSFKPDHEWFAWPPVYWSQTPTWDNYLNVWTSFTSYADTQYVQSLQKPWIALRNSLVISLLAIGTRGIRQIR